MTDKPTVTDAMRAAGAQMLLKCDQGGQNLSQSEKVERIYTAMHQASDTGDDDAEWFRNKWIGDHEEMWADLQKLIDRLAVLQPLLDERDAKIADLDAECERAWEAYRIAHDQAMSNGEALMEARAALTESKEPK
jgi:hypothetical protein